MPPLPKFKKTKINIIKRGGSSHEGEGYCLQHLLPQLPLHVVQKKKGRAAIGWQVREQAFWLSQLWSLCLALGGCYVLTKWSVPFWLTPARQVYSDPWVPFFVLTMSSSESDHHGVEMSEYSWKWLKWLEITWNDRIWSKINWNGLKWQEMSAKLLSS